MVRVLDSGLTTTVSAGIDYAATAEALTLYFDPDPHFYGSPTFQFAAKDDNGLADPTPATGTLNIAPVNDAPVATISPASYVATEQTPLVLHSTGMSIADLDAYGLNVQATLTVGEGTINANAGTTGVVIAGDGTGNVTLTGSVTQINDLLAGNNGGTVTPLR